MLYNAYSQKLSGQRTSRSRKDPISYFNIMVVGHAGTGKTMFIRTLCERLKPSIVQGTLKESRPMALKEQLRATEDLYSVSMHVEENGERTSFTLIDTPGFDEGLAIDHQLRYIAKYIDHQFERTLIEVIHHDYITYQSRMLTHGLIRRAKFDATPKHSTPRSMRVCTLWTH